MSSSGSGRADDVLLHSSTSASVDGNGPEDLPVHRAERPPLQEQQHPSDPPQDEDALPRERDLDPRFHDARHHADPFLSSSLPPASLLERTVLSRDTSGTHDQRTGASMTSTAERAHTSAQLVDVFSHLVTSSITSFAGAFPDSLLDSEEEGPTLGPAHVGGSAAAPGRSQAAGGSADPGAAAAATAAASTNQTEVSAAGGGNENSTAAARWTSLSALEGTTIIATPAMEGAAENVIDGDIDTLFWKDAAHTQVYY